MRALISGQAGVAVLLDGDHAASISVENPRPIPRKSSEWPYLLAGADDAYELNEVSQEEVASELNVAWRKDRSLHLVLILLDPQVRQETKRASAVFLEDLLSDGRILTHIRNRLHVAPLPRGSDLERANRLLGKQHPRISAVLEEITNQQDSIKLSRQAWELLPPDLFGGLRAKESFGFRAVEHGLFTSMSVLKDFDVSNLPREDREIVRRWRREVKSLREKSRSPGPGLSSQPKTSGGSSFARRRQIRHRAMALVAAACIAVAGIVIWSVYPVAVEASTLVGLGVSQPGFQVVQARLPALQKELYGRTPVSYVLRTSAKKKAEGLFISAESDAGAGRLSDAAITFRQSNASFPTIAARLNEAVALLNTSRLVEAERLLKALLPEAQQHGDRAVEAGISTDLGHVYRTLGLFDDANRAYSNALAIDRELGYTAGEAANRNNLALVLSDQGRNVAGLDGFTHALSLAEQAGANSVAADSHVNIGDTLAAFGRDQDADRNFKLAADYYSQKQDSPLAVAYYYLTLSDYMYSYDIAARFYGKTAAEQIKEMLLYSSRALDVYRSVSNKNGEALSLLAVAGALRAQGRLPEALAHYEQGLQLADEIGALPLKEVALREIGSWYFGVRQYEPAVQYIQQALGVAESIGDFGGRCVALEVLAQIAGIRGDRDMALRYVREAVSISIQSGDAFMQAVAYDDLGFLLYKSFRESAEALDALGRAYELYSRVNSPMRDGTHVLMDSIRKDAQASDNRRSR